MNFLHGTHWPAANPGEGWKHVPPEGPNFEYFRRFEPVEMVGYSYCIYHITRDEAERMRTDLGLPLLERGK